MNSHVIRSFKPADQHDVIALWNAIFTDDPPHNEPSLVIARKLTTQPDLFLVAIDENRVVGTVLAGYDGVRGWIHHLAVDTNCQRRGIGRDLMAAAELRLAARGCPKVNLQVRAGNAAVTKFYQALGYGIEERISLGKLLP